MKKEIYRALIEVFFIVFLFYANLLMGEYERSGRAAQMGLSWAVADVFTAANFLLAIMAALIGYVVVEFLRRKL